MKAFECWSFGSKKFLSVPTVGGVVIINEDGAFFGSYYSTKSFRDRQKDPFRFPDIMVPISSSVLSVRDVPRKIEGGK
jgi:hypothetical protein